MQGLKNRIIRTALATRARAFDRMRRDAAELQRRTFAELAFRGERTAFGHDHGLRAGMTYERFAEAVPVRDYDAFRPYVERMLAGERNVAAEGCARMFARSSGTTSDRSKYIPVTAEALWRNHLRGMRDVAAMYASEHPATRIFEGRALTLGGSCRTEHGALVGDLSAIVISCLPQTAGWLRLPDVRTALTEDFEAKAAAICRECTRRNVTSLAGVPSWNLALLRRILDYTGCDNLLEVWPHLEMFAHGGMGFAPYRAAFAEILPSEDFRYMETYNASEGFFAMADDLSRDDMMLMTDYGTFYEFRDGAATVPLEGVRSGGRYAMVITSCNGLWRYELGDVVEFTSTDPYRIRLVGRTRQFINVFGEELMADNAERALAEACRATGAVAAEYTAAPVYMTLHERGAHEWAVEFLHEPADTATFVATLDDALRRLNSDYDAKRRTTLAPPLVRALPRGTFERWLRRRGKNKVPHLCNDRRVMDEITETDAVVAEPAVEA
ncbi:MAG: GH3 auxin-responsive promoter family protein [Alistipes sp.]|nr:GH3 auxin-responsive promoter family protein [Alistipes sp.]